MFDWALAHPQVTLAASGGFFVGLIISNLFIGWSERLSEWASGGAISRRKMCEEYQRQAQFWIDKYVDELQESLSKTKQ